MSTKIVKAAVSLVALATSAGSLFVVSWIGLALLGDSLQSADAAAEALAENTHGQVTYSSTRTLWSTGPQTTSSVLIRIKICPASGASRTSAQNPDSGSTSNLEKL